MLNYKTELEEYVESLYKLINISNPEEIEMNIIAWKLNIRIIYSSFCSRAIRSCGHFIINLNECLTDQEQWEIFGHEVFHILKDAGNQDYIPIPLREMREHKANNFALHFCVPTFMLDKLRWPDRYAAGYVAETFHVSLPFAEKRLDQYRCQLFQNKLDQINSIREGFI